MTPELPARSIDPFKSGDPAIQERLTVLRESYERALAVGNETLVDRIVDRAFKLAQEH